MGTTYKGTVKFFSDEKGYGFIQSKDFQKDVFVHHSAIKMEGRRKLDTGEAVEFETREDDKGVKAMNVVRLGATAKTS